MAISKNCNNNIVLTKLTKLQNFDFMSIIFKAKPDQN
jgi:hypothetical protein